MASALASVALAGWGCGKVASEGSPATDSGADRRAGSMDARARDVSTDAPSPEADAPSVVSTHDARVDRDQPSGADAGCVGPECKCHEKCTSDDDCTANCPASGGTPACCDTHTGSCYLEAFADTACAPVQCPRCTTDEECQACHAGRPGTYCCDQSLQRCYESGGSTCIPFVCGVICAADRDCEAFCPSAPAGSVSCCDRSSSVCILHEGTSWRRGRPSGRGGDLPDLLRGRPGLPAVLAVHSWLGVLLRPDVEGLLCGARAVRGRLHDLRVHDRRRLREPLRRPGRRGVLLRHVDRQLRPGDWLLKRREGSARSHRAVAQHHLHHDGTRHLRTGSVQGDTVERHSGRQALGRQRRERDETPGGAAPRFNASVYSCRPRRGRRARGRAPRSSGALGEESVAPPTRRRSRPSGC